MSKVRITCKHCNKPFILGETGTVHGCDNCLGVKRDIWGRPWFPGDKIKTYEAVATGETYTVTREQAFGGKS